MNKPNTISNFLSQFEHENLTVYNYKPMAQKLTQEENAQRAFTLAVSNHCATATIKPTTPEEAS